MTKRLRFRGAAQASLLAACAALGTAWAASPHPAYTGSSTEGGYRTAASVSMTGQIGGGALAVEATTDWAYLAVGPTVRKLDTRPLTRPSLAASSEPFGDVVRDLAIGPDNLLLVAAGRDGLAALGPSGARVGGEITRTMPAFGVAHAAGLAYVSVPGTGIVVVDPATSAVRGTAPVTRVVGPIDVTGDGLAAVVVDGGRVVAVDARNPMSTSIGAPFGAGVLGLDFDSERLLTAGAGGVVIYRAGSGQPERIGEWTGGAASSIVGAGNTAIVGLDDGTGVVLSLADPGRPSEESRFDLAGRPSALALAGTKLSAAVNRGPDPAADPYAAGGGLEVIDVAGSRPARFSLLEFPSGRLLDVVVVGTTAWAVEAALGPESPGRAWSVQLNPRGPEPMGSANLDGTPYSVAAMPPHGFFTASSGLLVTRNDDSGALRPAKHAESVRTGPADLASWSAFLWAVGGTEGFEVLDVSYPLDVRPVPLTSSPDLMGATTVAVEDGLAYAAGENGLAVVDVRDETHPRTLARITSVGPASDVAATGEIALVANRNDGLRVVDAGAVSEIRQVGALGGAGLVSVAAHEAAGYTMDSAGNLTVVDLTDPAAPMAVADAPRPALMSDTSGGPLPADGSVLAAARTVAVVANPARGLLVYSVEDAPGPTPTAVSDPLPIYLPSASRAAPASPARYSLASRGNYSPINTRPHGFTVVGTTAYIGIEGGSQRWLATVDMAEPSLPVNLGRTEDFGGMPLRVAAQGPLAVVADDDAGLIIVDATNKSLPVVTGRFDTQANLINVALMRDTRHVVGIESLGGSGSSHLVVYDISNPARPTELGRLALGDTAPSGLALDEQTAFVTDSTEGLVEIDLSDVSRPTVTDSRSVAGAGEAVVPRVRELASRRDRIGLVNRGNEAVPGGLWILDAGEEGLPEVGSLVSIDWPDVQGGRQGSWYGRLLLAASEDDVLLYDVSDERSPRLFTEIVDRYQDIHDVLLDDPAGGGTARFAYLTDPVAGFVVLDVVPDR